MGKDTPFLYFSLAYFTGKRTVAQELKQKLSVGEI